MKRHPMKKHRHKLTPHPMKKWQIDVMATREPSQDARRRHEQPGDMQKVKLYWLAQNGRGYGHEIPR